MALEANNLREQQRASVITHIRMRHKQKRHLHFDDDVLIFVLHGRTTLSGCGHGVCVSQGSLAYIQQGQFLLETPESECDLLIAELPRDNVLRFLQHHAEEVAKKFTGVEKEHSAVLVCNGSVLIREAFMSLLLLDRFDHPDKLTQMKLEELLLLVLCTDVGTDLVALLRRNSYSRAERLRYFMEQHFLEDWCLEEYASHFGMGLTAFKGLFSEVFGVSPRAWINERRLLYAHHLLITSDLPILHVAMESGFSSQSYFTQAYRRRFGFAPSKTRKGDS